MGDKSGSTRKVRRSSRKGWDMNPIAMKTWDAKFMKRIAVHDHKFDRGDHLKRKGRREKIPGSMRAIRYGINDTRRNAMENDTQNQGSKGEGGLGREKVEGNYKLKGK